MAKAKKNIVKKDALQSVSKKISKVPKLKIKQKLSDVKVSGEYQEEKAKPHMSTKIKRKRKRGNKTLNREKKGKKRNRDEVNDGETLTEIPALTRSSDEPTPKKKKWTNRQRVLVFGCRGISHRDRHLMKDIRSLLPHSRPESKLERRENLAVVNEVCTMKNCNKCIMLEGRLQRDIYMWVSNVPHGPSMKFLLENVYTMEELHFTGNCLVGSRPLLSFDSNFDTNPQFKLMKELFIQVFGTPNHHPKSQPFIDHVFTFSILDNRIWFRNYQILSEDGALVEIGPRFAMNPVKIFRESFGGETLWQNPLYITPSKYRQELRKSLGGRYMNRIHQKLIYDSKKKRMGKTYDLPQVDEVFTANPWEKAKEIASRPQDNNSQSSVSLKNKKKKKKLRKGQKPKKGNKG